MSPLTIIVNFNKIKHTSSGLVASFVFLVEDLFAFKRSEEALDTSVIPTLALTAHTAYHAVGSKLSLV